MNLDRRSQLLEDYEDAIFALAMNDLMQEEGEYWEEENERLKSDPDFVLPEKMNRRCMRAIERRIAKKEHCRTGSVVWKAASRFAVAFLAVFVVFSFTFVTVSAVRLPVLDLVISTFGEGAFVRAESVISAPELDVASFGPKDLPGENWTKSFVIDNEAVRMVRNDYDDGSYIEYTETSAENFTATIDTEDANTYEMTIGDTIFYFVSEGTEFKIVWVDEENDKLCELHTEGFEETELRLILTSISK